MATWIGPGVFEHEGTTYYPGDELPELGEGVKASLVSKGKATEATEVIEPAPAGPKQNRKGAKHND